MMFLWRNVEVYSPFVYVLTSVAKLEISVRDEKSCRSASSSVLIKELSLSAENLKQKVKLLRNEFNFWNVHGIMNT